MVVIKSLEKIYVFKGVGIPEYYLGGNVEFLRESWKNQGLGLALSARAYIQNFIPKFLESFWQAQKGDLPLCALIKILQSSGQNSLYYFCCKQVQHVIKRRTFGESDTITKP
jgi:hypothetical protein